MEDRVQFDINESLKYYLSDPAFVPTPEADSKLLDCETDPDQLSTGLIDNVLNSIVDGVAESPEGLTRSSLFYSLQFLLKCVPNPAPDALRLDGLNAELMEFWQKLGVSSHAVPQQTSRLSCVWVIGRSGHHPWRSRVRRARCHSAP